MTNNAFRGDVECEDPMLRCASLVKKLFVKNNHRGTETQTLHREIRLFGKASLTQRESWSLPALRFFMKQLKP
jgi:hypothetical protein